MDSIILKCPNCSAIIPAELKKDLYAGNNVTCENCGILIIPKTPPRGGHPAPSNAFPRDGTPNGVQPRGAPEGARHPVHRHEPARTASPRPPAMPGGWDTPFDAEALREKLPGYRKFIQSYNDVAHALMKIFLGIFFVVSFATIAVTWLVGPPMLNWSGFLENLASVSWFYILGAFMYWYDKKKVYPWVKRGQFDFYGIDLFVLGLAGMGVFGLGILPFLKGIFIMAYMGAEDKVNGKTKRDKLVGWIHGLDEISWQIVAVAALTGFAFLFHALVSGVQSMILSDMMIAGLVVGISGTISANADRHAVSPYIREYRFSGLGGKTLVNSIIGMVCCGSGVPMFVKAILLFVLEEEDKKVPPATYKPRSPGDGTGYPQKVAVAGTTAVTSPGPLQGTAGSPVLVASPAGADMHVVHAGGKEPMPGGAPPGGPRHGARHGGLASPAGTPVVPPAGTRPVSPVAPYLPPKEPGSIEAYLHRSFSVLTPKVRRRLNKLKKLGLHSEDISAIADELVHHPEFEQLEIIDQYIALNKEDEVDPMYVLVVRNMAYPDEMKQWILSQLKMLKDEDVPPFLEEMQKAQPR